MKRFKIHARVEHIGTDLFKAFAFALPNELGAIQSETVEGIAASGDEATRLAFFLASGLARAIRTRGDAVEGLVIT
jgi:hypothetical protein